MTTTHRNRHSQPITHKHTDTNRARDRQSHTHTQPHRPILTHTHTHPHIHTHTHSQPPSRVFTLAAYFCKGLGVEELRSFNYTSNIHT